MKSNIGLAIIALLTASATIAAADRPSRGDALADCEALAVAMSREDSNPLSSVRIDRDPDHLAINRYEHRVGQVMVPTEYMGWAVIAYGNQPPQRVRFICLHTGSGGRAIYTALIPNDL